MNRGRKIPDRLTPQGVQPDDRPEPVKSEWWGMQPNDGIFWYNGIGRRCSMSLPAGVMPGHKALAHYEIRSSDENWARESGFPVGVYIRISTDSDLQKTSIGNQERSVREWCSDKNHYYPVHDVYIDDARSGAYMHNRAEVQRLMADAHAGRIKGIVTKEISRVSRDVLDTLSIKRALDDSGACYIDIIHGYDSRKDGDEIFLVMYGVIAQKERRTTGRRVAMTMTQKAKDGKNPCIRAAFGYMKAKENKDQLVPDPERAPYYREIVARFLAGQGKKRICNWLNESGVFTNLGKPWLPASINVVLRNPVYLGHTFWATTKVVKGGHGRAKIVARPQEEWVFKENTHEALISKEEWDQVQALFASRLEESNASGVKGRKFTKTYPLVGYLRCGVCGSHLYGHKFTKRPKGKPMYHNFYYTCHRELGHCKLPYQRQEDLERKVNQAILDLVSDTAIIRQQVAKQSHLYVDGMDEMKVKREELSKRLEKLVEGSKRLGMDRVMGTITEAEFSEQMSMIREVRRQVEEELGRLDKQLGRADNADAQAERIVAAIRELVLPSDPGVTDEVMEQLYFLLIRRVAVTADGSLDIEWTFEADHTAQAAWQ
jgi:site-specific DNA recombinase